MLDGVGAVTGDVARVSRGKGGIGVTGVGGCAEGLGITVVVVDVVTLGHDINLVLSKHGHLLGDDGGSTLGQVRMSEQYVKLLKCTAGSLGVVEVDNGKEEAVGDGEEEESPRAN